MIVINKKYKLRLLSDFIKVSPELAKLLNTLTIISKPSKLLKYIKQQNIIDNIKRLNWSGGFYRKDIGYKVIKK